MEIVMVYYHKDSDIMDIWFGSLEDEVTKAQGKTYIIHFSIF
jgi:hypothetical protein